MRPLDEAIKKPEAAGTGAYIEVVTEADERLRMNEKDLPGEEPCGTSFGPAPSRKIG
jgi:hypothetical protein